MKSILWVLLFVGGVIPSHALLPSQVDLQSIHEMAWTQESHRTRLLAIAHEKLKDNAFVERLLKLENIQGLNSKDIEDFKQFTLFRVANHDFKKGTFDNALGLSRINGFDIDRLSGSEKDAAKAVVKEVNASGWFIEHKIHDFVFEHDDFGKLLTGPEKAKRQKLGELSAHFEHALDLHDRHMAAKVSTEWNRPMMKGSEWIDHLQSKMSFKRLWAYDQLGQEYNTLRSTKKVSKFVEAEIDAQTYKTMTKGMSVPEYLSIRRTKAGLDYSDIVRERGLAVNAPRVLKPFLPANGVIKQTNVESITKKIMAFTEDNKNGLERVAKTSGRFLRGASKVANVIGKVAVPAQMAYGTYVFATSGDLGKGFAAGAGISEAGASDETSLYSSGQQRLFFGLSRIDQERLLKSIPNFQDWLKDQFLDQPVETQIGLLCQDASLSEISNMPCVHEVKCEGGLPSKIDVESLGSEGEKQVQIHYPKNKDPLRPYSKMYAMDVYSNGILQQSFVLSSKERLTGVSKSNKAMKHWILVNSKAFERACQYNQTKILAPQIPKETRPSHSAFNIFLGYLNQRYKAENPEVQTADQDDRTGQR